MDPELALLAERIEAMPWNRPGTDKTWVVNAMSSQLEFRKETSEARLVGAD